ncbi:MAG: DUF6232 family protein [Actinoallomurus sp.]
MPTRAGDAKIILNTRTLRIGNQTFSLHNIARVQIKRLPKSPEVGKLSKLSKSARKFFSCATMLLVFFFASSLLFGILSILGNWTQLPALIIALILAIFLGLVVYGITERPNVPRYALVLESTGVPHTGVVSTDHNELERLSRRIVDAIENPPTTEQVITVHNAVLGDQYNQFGDDNIGRMG